MAEIVAIQIDSGTLTFRPQNKTQKNNRRTTDPGLGTRKFFMPIWYPSSIGNSKSQGTDQSKRARPADYSRPYMTEELSRRVKQTKTLLLRKGRPGSVWGSSIRIGKTFPRTCIPDGNEYYEQLSNRIWNLKISLSSVNKTLQAVEVSFLSRYIPLF